MIQDQDQEGWQDKISDTSMQAKSRIRREVIKLAKFPKQRDELAQSFIKLKDLGFIREYDQFTKEERIRIDGHKQRYVLPVSI